MKKEEKIVITVEIEDLPAGSQILDFQITTIDKHWLSRLFKDWKKVTYRKATVTSLTVEKL